MEPENSYNDSYETYNFVPIINKSINKSLNIKGKAKRNSIQHYQISYHKDMESIKQISNKNNDSVSPKGKKNQENNLKVLILSTMTKLKKKQSSQKLKKLNSNKITRQLVNQYSYRNIEPNISPSNKNNKNLLSARQDNNNKERTIRVMSDHRFQQFSNPQFTSNFRIIGKEINQSQDKNIRNVKNNNDINLFYDTPIISSQNNNNIISSANNQEKLDDEINKNKFIVNEDKNESNLEFNKNYNNNSANDLQSMEDIIIMKTNYHLLENIKLGNKLKINDNSNTSEFLLLNKKNDMNKLLNDYKYNTSEIDVKNQSIKNKNVSLSSSLINKGKKMINKISNLLFGKNEENAIKESKSENLIENKNKNNNNSRKLSISSVKINNQIGRIGVGKNKLKSNFIFKEDQINTNTSINKLSCDNVHKNMSKKKITERNTSNTNNITKLSFKNNIENLKFNLNKSNNIVIYNINKPKLVLKHQSHDKLTYSKLNKVTEISVSPNNKQIKKIINRDIVPHDKSNEKISKFKYSNNELDKSINLNIIIKGKSNSFNVNSNLHGYHGNKNIHKLHIKKLIIDKHENKLNTEPLLDKKLLISRNRIVSNEKNNNTSDLTNMNYIRNKLLREINSQSSDKEMTTYKDTQNPINYNYIDKHNINKPKNLSNKELKIVNGNSKTKRNSLLNSVPIDSNNNNTGNTDNNGTSFFRIVKKRNKNNNEDKLKNSLTEKIRGRRNGVQYFNLHLDRSKITIKKINQVYDSLSENEDMLINFNNNSKFNIDIAFKANSKVYIVFFILRITIIVFYLFFFIYSISIEPIPINFLVNMNKNNKFYLSRNNNAIFSEALVHFSIFFDIAFLFIYIIEIIKNYESEDGIGFSISKSLFRILWEKSYLEVITNIIAAFPFYTIFLIYVSRSTLITDFNEAYADMNGNNSNDISFNLTYDMDYFFSIKYNDLSQKLLSNTFVLILSHFRWLKVFSLITLNEIISLLRNFFDLSMLVSLSLYTPIYLIYVHAASCLWIYIGKLEFNSNNFWLKHYDLLDSSCLSIYINSLYFNVSTVFTVGYGDISPQNSIEYMYSNVILIISCSLYSTMLSAFSSKFNDSEQKYTALQKKKDVLESINFQSHLPDDLYNKIQMHLYNSLSLIKEERHLLIDSLPSSIRNELLLSMYWTALESLSFFKDCNDDFNAFMLSLLKPLNLEKNEVLYQIGSLFQEMFFVLEGQLNFFFVGFGKNLKFFILRKGDNFGEINILETETIEYEIRGSTIAETQLLVLSKEDFELVKSNYPELLKIKMKNSFNMHSVMLKNKNLANKFWTKKINKKIKQESKNKSSNSNVINNKDTTGSLKTLNKKESRIAFNHIIEDLDDEEYDEVINDYDGFVSQSDESDKSDESKENKNVFSDSSEKEEFDYTLNDTESSNDLDDFNEKTISKYAYNFSSLDDDKDSDYENKNKLKGTIVSYYDDTNRNSYLNNNFLKITNQVKKTNETLLENELNGKLKEEIYTNSERKFNASNIDNCLEKRTSFANKSNNNLKNNSINNIIKKEISHKISTNSDIILENNNRERDLIKGSNSFPKIKIFKKLKSSDCLTNKINLEYIDCLMDNDNINFKDDQISYIDNKLTNNSKKRITKIKLLEPKLSNNDNDNNIYNREANIKKKTVFNNLLEELRLISNHNIKIENKKKHKKLYIGIHNNKVKKYNAKIISINTIKTNDYYNNSEDRIKNIITNKAEIKSEVKGLYQKIIKKSQYLEDYNIINKEYSNHHYITINHNNIRINIIKSYLEDYYGLKDYIYTRETYVYCSKQRREVTNANISINNFLTNKTYYYNLSSKQNSDNIDTYDACDYKIKDSEQKIKKKIKINKTSYILKYGIYYDLKRILNNKKLISNQRINSEDVLFSYKITNKEEINDIVKKSKYLKLKEKQETNRFNIPIKGLNQEQNLKNSNNNNNNNNNNLKLNQSPKRQIAFKKQNLPLKRITKENNAKYSVTSNLTKKVVFSKYDTSNSTSSEDLNSQIKLRNNKRKSKKNITLSNNNIKLKTNIRNNDKINFTTNLANHILNKPDHPFYKKFNLNLKPNLENNKKNNRDSVFSNFSDISALKPNDDSISKRKSNNDIKFANLAEKQRLRTQKSQLKLKLLEKSNSNNVNFYYPNKEANKKSTSTYSRNKMNTNIRSSFSIDKLIDININNDLRKKTASSDIISLYMKNNYSVSRKSLHSNLSKANKNKLNKRNKYSDILGIDSISENSSPESLKAKHKNKSKDTNIRSNKKIKNISKTIKQKSLELNATSNKSIPKRITKKQKSKQKENYQHHQSPNNISFVSLKGNISNLKTLISQSGYSIEKNNIKDNILIKSTKKDKFASPYKTSALARTDKHQFNKSSEKSKRSSLASPSNKNNQLHRKRTLYIEKLFDKTNQEKELIENTEILGNFFKNSILNELKNRKINNKKSEK